MNIGWFFSLAPALLTGAYLYIRIRYMRARHEAFFGPHLYAQIEAMFEPFEGKQVDDEVLIQLEREAARKFEDILNGVGLLSSGWHLKVELDDLLGPVPRIHGPNGQLLTVSAFEHRLRTGALELRTP